VGPRTLQEKKFWISCRRGRIALARRFWYLVEENTVSIWAFGGIVKKFLIGVPIVLVGLVASIPFLAPLADIEITYTDMYHMVVPKQKKKVAVRPENEAPPKTFDAQKCDELLDLNKFPDTQLNGKLYQGDKETDAIFKSGQARVKGDRVELKFFSSEGRATCKDTDANGATPQDFTLVVSISKAELDAKKDTFKFGWDLFGTQPLDYYYIAPGAAPSSTPTSAASAPATTMNPMSKQLLAGLVGNITLEEKAGGKVKGKGIMCFAQPSPNAAPASKPADWEEGDPLPPVGLRHAVAGNFEIDFCQ
jgi:hypothetical protein